ncbi:MAG: D-aminoacyl-tRNA deacylase [Candidatus Micrarchaeaceae archaeon]
MIAIVYSSKDAVSNNAAESLISGLGLEESGPGAYGSGGIMLKRLETGLTGAAEMDKIGADLIIFMSRHSSSSGIPALTVHSMGNWGIEARLGGIPRTLSMSAPSAMLEMLKRFNSSGLEVDKTYEATHHGPALSTPSFFAEFGGDDALANSKPVAAELGGMVYEVADSLARRKPECSKVVIGIGSNHYPRKFTRLALERGYAFSHIMPKHAMINGDGSGNIGMIEQAMKMSSEKVESAVIEWKSLSSAMRSDIIKKLDGIGIGYERI